MAASSATSRYVRSACRNAPMTKVRVGLCRFSMAFEDYVREFPVVEVQQTFYEPPRDATMRRWRAEAPADFEFTLKAWQLVTHDAPSPTYRRLRRTLTMNERAESGSFRMTPIVLDAWARTLECVALLRATAVLLQCPRSFGPTDENVGRMRAFFGAAAWRSSVMGAARRMATGPRQRSVRRAAARPRRRPIRDADRDAGRDIFPAARHQRRAARLHGRGTRAAGGHAADARDGAALRAVQQPAPCRRCTSIPPGNADYGRSQCTAA
jgi:uncharacterized protein YecE (DUF72 family)